MFTSMFTLIKFFCNNILEFVTPKEIVNKLKRKELQLKKVS